MNKSREKGKDDSLALPQCPFLAYKTASENNGQGSFTQIICEAGGGFVLGTTASIAVAQEICHSCDIPQSLTLRYACLYVVPFRVFQGNQVQSYYGCRWYFYLNPRNTPKNMDLCMGCRDWFPRPHESLITDKVAMSQKFLQIFLNPIEYGKRSSHCNEEKMECGWLIRMRSLLFRWFSDR